MKKQISLLLTVCLSAASLVFPASAQQRDGAIDLNGKTQTGSEGYGGSPYTNAFDGDTDTFFDGKEGGYCQVDLGQAYDVTQISFYPRGGRSEDKPAEYVERMKGGKFYGSLDNSQWTELYSVPDSIFTDRTDASIVKWYDVSDDSVKGTYRYIKYENTSTYANIAEIEVYGAPSQEQPRQLLSRTPGSSFWTEQAGRLKQTHSSPHQAETAWEWYLTGTRVLYGIQAGQMPRSMIPIQIRSI